MVALIQLQQEPPATMAQKQSMHLFFNLSTSIIVFSYRLAYNFKTLGVSLAWDIYGMHLGKRRCLISSKLATDSSSLWKGQWTFPR